MITSTHRTRASVLLICALALGSSCATAPRESAERNEPARRGYVEADVRFMQGMITHHQQALEMTDLVSDRTDHEGIHALAGRIEISQIDEIESMRRWLESRDESVPEEHDHGPLMPGMLTEEQMERLAGAEGAEFDRLFLEGMIQHHEGALVMVEELFDSEGAGQEPQIFVFASHVDADQRAEIARMRNVLNHLSQGGTE